MTHDHEHGTDAEGMPSGPLADASVRSARPSDAPAVGLVQAAVWRDAYAGVLPGEAVAGFEPQAFARVWRESLEHPPSGVFRLLVACAGQQVVGFAATGPTQDPDGTPTTGEILALGVHPGARRQGHGSRLLNACVDLLRDAGADTVHAWLLSVHEDTRAFLDASGLHPDGAFRDRVVSPDGATLREVRVVAAIDPEAGAEARSESSSVW